MRALQRAPPPGGGRCRVKRKTKFLAGAGIIVVAISYLIYSAARETSAYYLTMDEFARQRASLAGEPIRLAGRVTSGSVHWDPKTLDLDFQVQPIPPKKGATAASTLEASDARATSAAPVETLAVHYNGVLPDMFADGRDVIVEGKLEQGVFHAKSLLTTCPSKYEAEDRGAGEAGTSAPKVEG